MFTVLLAGVPEKLVRQSKSAVQAIARAGIWDVRFFPSRSNSAEISPTQINELLQRAEDAAGAHVIGFHQTDNRASVAQQIRPHFRFRWGDAGMLWTVGSGPDQFRAHVQAMLDEEMLWREHVMPRDKSSPLILPANIFVPTQGHVDIWGQSEMYGREPEHFEQLAKKIRHFSSDHTKFYKPNHPTFMVDRSGLVWKDAGPYHAKTPFFRRWKYSIQLPDKFHFDVEHQKGEAFVVRDADNAVINVKMNKHVNIDCHGYRSH